LKQPGEGERKGAMPLVSFATEKKKKRTRKKGEERPYVRRGISREKRKEDRGTREPLKGKGKSPRKRGKKREKKRGAFL